MQTPMMNNLAAVRQFSGTPALLSAAHVDSLVSFAAAPAVGIEAHNQHLDQVAAAYGLPGRDIKPFLFSDGTAVIPVWGVLLHRGPWCAPWATGYGYIEQAIEAAAADPDVERILLDINSTGGHVAGNFELASRIREINGSKPVTAVVDSRALSGGYSLAAACGQIIATPSSDIGSIGVLLCHMSLEGALEKFGVEVSFIHAGKHKVDGNPYQNLPEDVRKDLQASVNASYESFVSLVADYRGLDKDAVRATEARVFGAEEALSLGLVDAVMPARAAYATVVQGASASTHSTQEVSTMSEVTKAEAAEQAKTAAAEASTAERARVAGILQHAEAEGRGQMANHLAFNTSMSVEEAAALMASAPKEQKQEAAAAAAPAAGPLAAAMAGDTNVTVGVEGGKDKEADGGSRTNRLIANYQAAGGRLD